MVNETWPPSFTLDQERVLNLLTGDRFYSNPSASLREAVLNAIDAVQRRRKKSPEPLPEITVTFNRSDLTLAVADNGIGMNRRDISVLFTKVGASAANEEAKKESVGEFGIGVISYFMAGDAFELQTNDGATEPIGLSFSRSMLAGGGAQEIKPTQNTQGTTVTLRVRDAATFQVLVDSYPHWCRDVDGLYGRLQPDNIPLNQRGAHRPADAVTLEHPSWVERSHLSPVANPTGWDAMTGVSTVAVLYRGVFVQEFRIKGAWGIDGSIDVDPKHFKPRLNREAFVEGQFQPEVEAFLRQSHPAILEAMVHRLSEAVDAGRLDKWTEKRWATLWLSVPRSAPYAAAVKAWDTVFRALPAFELAAGNRWEAVSLDRLKTLSGEVFVAPLAEEKTNDVMKAALHFLRTTRQHVIRGIRKDSAWMRDAPGVYGTTADLISNVFSSELPTLVHLAQRAEQILAQIERIAPLFTGPPPVDLARLGSDSPPALRLKGRLVINIDHPMGAAIARDAVDENHGPTSLISLTARHAYEQLTEVAATVREITAGPEILSPVRRRFIRRYLS
jgi:hypothetical protein